MLWPMDDQGTGRALRAIRLHRRLRQVDIAGAARVSQSSVSRMERGHLGSLSLNTLRRVTVALEATLDVGIRWRGGEIDRVVGARHAAMTERIVSQLDAIGGWQWAAEASFSAWGERGVIDLLAWHAGRRRLLVIELKTELVDPAALLAQVDRYRRLAPAVARGRGWAVPGPGTLRAVGPARAAGAGESWPVACWVVVADTSSNRARLARHRTMLRGTFPVDGRRMAGWLADPRVSLMGLSFLPDMARETGTRLGPIRRVRGRSTSPARSRPPSVADALTGALRPGAASRSPQGPHKSPGAHGQEEAQVEARTG